MLDLFDVLPHLGKACSMVFMGRRLFNRSDSPSCRVAHAHATLLLELNVMSKL